MSFGTSLSSQRESIVGQKLIAYSLNITRWGTDQFDTNKSHLEEQISYFRFYPEAKPRGPKPRWKTAQEQCPNHINSLQ